MNSMNKTIKKLSEAEFFLEKMRSEYDKHDDFEYYFSAFISACRSVLWVLKAECGKNENWLLWYESKVPKEDELRFLKKTNEIRVRSEKHTPLEAGLMETMALDKASMPDDIYDFFVKGNVDELDIKFYDSNSVLINGEHVVPIVENRFYKEVDEFKGEDIVDICSRYFEMISEVVNESKSYLDQNNH